MLPVPIEPVASLIAGALIFVMPRLLNYVVAVYLVVIGCVGLFEALDSRQASTAGTPVESSMPMQSGLLPQT